MNAVVRQFELPPNAHDRILPVHRRQPEYDEQVRFFVLVELLTDLHPAARSELLDVWATSNGGKRSKGTAGRMREAGQRKGVLDIECLVPRDTVHGLLIEMKSGRGRVTPEQQSRIDRLSARGYQTSVARSWLEAGQTLCQYLGLPWPDHAEVRVELALRARVGHRRNVRRAARQWRRAGRGNLP